MGGREATWEYSESRDWFMLTWDLFLSHHLVIVRVSVLVEEQGRHVGLVLVQVTDILQVLEIKYN